MGGLITLAVIALMVVFFNQLLDKIIFQRADNAIIQQTKHFHNLTNDFGHIDFQGTHLKFLYVLRK